MKLLILLYSLLAFSGCMMPGAGTGSSFDHQNGLTVVTIGGARYYAFAERRRSDGAVRIMTEPVSENTQLHIERLTSWTQNDQIWCKLHLTLTHRHGNTRKVNITNVAIRLKDVDEFSFTGTPAYEDAHFGLFYKGAVTYSRMLLLALQAGDRTNNPALSPVNIAPLR